MATRKLTFAEIIQGVDPSTKAPPKIKLYDYSPKDSLLNTPKRVITPQPRTFTTGLVNAGSVKPKLPGLTASSISKPTTISKTTPQIDVSGFKLGDRYSNIETKPIKPKINDVTGMSKRFLPKEKTFVETDARKIEQNKYGTAEKFFARLLDEATSQTDRMYSSSAKASAKLYADKNKVVPSSITEIAGIPERAKERKDVLAGDTAGDVGGFVGNMLKFAVAYQATGSSIADLVKPGITKVLGKTALSGKWLNLATNMTVEGFKDAIIGQPMEIIEAFRNGEIKNIKDLGKKVGETAVIDIVANGVFEAIGKIAKIIKKSDITNELIEQTVKNTELENVVKEANDSFDLVTAVKNKFSPELPEDFSIQNRTKSMLNVEPQKAVSEVTPKTEIVEPKSLVEQSQIAKEYDVNKILAEEMQPEKVLGEEVVQGKSLVEQSKPIKQTEKAVAEELTTQPKELVDRYEELIKEQMDYIETSGKQGVESPALFRDELGEVVGGTGGVSNNPRWYQEFYAKEGRSPNKSEYRELAIKQLREGFDDVTMSVPKSKEFLNLEKSFDSKIDISSLENSLPTLKTEISIKDIEANPQKYIDKINEYEQLIKQIPLNKKGLQMFSESEIKAIKRVLNNAKIKTLKGADLKSLERIKFLDNQINSLKQTLSTVSDLKVPSVVGKMPGEAKLTGRVQGDIKLKKYQLNQKIKELTSQQKQVDRVTRTEALDRIAKIVKQSKNFSEKGQNALKEITQNIDLTSKSIRPNTKLKLSNTVNYLEKEFGSEYGKYIDPNLKTKLERLNNKQISDMTLKEIDELQDSIADIVQYEQIKSGDFKTSKGMTLSEDIDAIVTNMPKGRNAFMDRSFGTVGTIDWLRPVTFFKTLSDYGEDGIYKRVFRPIVEGNEIRASVIRDMNLKYLDNLRTKYPKLIEELMKVKKAPKYAVDILDTNMSKNEILDLYAVSKDDGQIRGLIENGHTKIDGTTLQFDINKVNSFQKYVEQNYPELIDMYNTGKVIYGELGNLSNKTYESINYRPLFTEVNENYYPATRNKTLVEKTFAENPKSLPPSLQGYSFLKERVSNNIGTQGKPYYSTLLKHIDESANYIGLGKAVNDARIILDTPQVKTKLKEYGNVVKGDKVTNSTIKYAKNWLNDVSRTNIVGENILSKTRRNVARSILGLNPSIIVKQTASLPTSLVSFNPVDFVGHNLLKQVDDKIIYRYAPTLYERFAKGTSTLEAGDLSKIGGIDLAKGIKKADEITIRRIWNIAENQVRRLEPNLKYGSDEFYKRVGRVTQDAVYESQPMYDIVFRTGLQRNQNELLKTLTMFSTQRQQNFNIFIDSINEAVKQKNYKKAIQSISGLTAGLMTYAGISTGIKKTLQKKDVSFGDELKESAISNIALFSDIINTFEDGYDIQSFGLQQINTFRKTAKALSDFYSVVEDEDGKKSLNKKVYAPYSAHKTEFALWTDFFESVGALTGVPVYNIKRNIQYAANQSPELKYKFDRLFYYDGNKNLYEDYFNIVKDGAITDKEKKVLTLLEADLVRNGVKSENLKKSLQARFKGIGLTTEEANIEIGKLPDISNITTKK